MPSWWSRVRDGLARRLGVIGIRLPPGMGGLRFVLFALLAIMLGLVLGALPLVILAVISGYMFSLFWFGL